MLEILLDMISKRFIVSAKQAEGFVWLFSEKSSAFLCEPLQCLSTSVTEKIRRIICSLICKGQYLKLITFWAVEKWMSS